MKEKLIIKNFGPIKDIELDLGRFNVLIGENATGKSTVAKILAVCRYFSFITNFNYFEKQGSAFSWGLISWGLEDFVKHNTYVFYSCYHYSVEGNAVKPIRDKWVENNISEKIFDIDVKLTPISKDFKKLISELKKLNKNEDSFSLSDTPATFFQNNVAKIMDNPFYLPAERGLQSIFSLGKSSIQNISDSLFNQLASIDRLARSFKKETEIEPLKITYKNENGRNLIRSRRHGFLSLSNAPSGYKSTIPIILVVKNYIEKRKKRKTFIIEEPEVNLFPEAQQKLMQYLVDKTMNYGNSVLVTTHSPYTLTSLNNMMYAFKVGEMNNNETENILPKTYWLNPNEVSVYMMLKTGKCESILDKEDLIKAEKIDSVSIALNKDFNAIMDIELSIEK